MMEKILETIKIALSTLLYSTILPRSKEMDRLLEEIIRNDPPIEYLDEFKVKFEGYPPLWIANFPYACFNIYRIDIYPTIPMVYRFRKFLERKIVEMARRGEPVNFAFKD